MTIELPLVLWTLISFGVFWLLLDRILFRPLLRVMHEREDKIRAGKTAGEAADAALQRDAEENLLKREEQLQAISAADAEAMKKALAAREARLAQGRREAEDAYQAGLLRLREEESACEAALASELPRLTALAAATLTGK